MMKAIQEAVSALRTAAAREREAYIDHALRAHTGNAERSRKLADHYEKIAADLAFAAIGGAVLVSRPVS